MIYDHHFSALRLERADGVSPPVYPSRLSHRPGTETRAPSQAYLRASHKWISVAHSEPREAVASSDSMYSSVKFIPSSPDVAARPGLHA
jgi:hypothetical protein